MIIYNVYESKEVFFIFKDCLYNLRLDKYSLYLTGSPFQFVILWFENKPLQAKYKVSAD